ncbi:hypothetical protein HG530_011385 [Fusarium avenaceum]|nr:hypothetical protein HG530_011385 [Fusarium avenaceum]
MNGHQAAPRNIYFLRGDLSEHLKFILGEERYPGEYQAVESHTKRPNIDLFRNLGLFCVEIGIAQLGSKERRGANCLGKFKVVIKIFGFRFGYCIIRGWKFASHLAFYATSFGETNMRKALLAPNNFAEFHVFKDHINLLEFRVIDDFEECNHIRMTYLLQYGDFLFRLVLGGLCRNLSEASLLRKTWNDLDGHIFASLEVAG